VATSSSLQVASDGQDKAPDAIDFEDIGSSDLEADEEGEERKGVTEMDVEEGREKKAATAAAELVQQLKPNLAGTVEDDDDTDYGSLFQLPFAGNGAAPQPTPMGETSMRASASQPVPTPTRPFSIFLGEEKQRRDKMEDGVSNAHQAHRAQVGELSASHLPTTATPSVDTIATTTTMPTTSLPSSAAIGGPKVLPPMVASVLTGSAVVFTPSVKEICSSLFNGGDGPILKFSELFAPQRYAKRTRQRQTTHAKGRVVQSTSIDEEEDEEEVFSRLRHIFTLPADEVSDDDEEAGDTAVVSEAQGLSSTQLSAPERDQEVKPAKKLLASVPSPVHEAVQTWPWEEEILWSDSSNGDDCDDSSTKAACRHTLEPPPQNPRPPPPPAAAIAGDATQGVTLSSWGALGEEDVNAKRWHTSGVSTHPDGEDIVVGPREWSLFPVVNEDFERYDNVLTLLDGPSPYALVVCLGTLHPVALGWTLSYGMTARSLQQQ